MAIGRVLRGEILDHLPADDPAAQRSRQDLRLINGLMGNTAWVRASLARMHPKRVVELGAGEGLLCRRIKSWNHKVSVEGIDRMPRPATLPPGVGWKEGDLFETLPRCEMDAVIGVMILHHLNDEQLGRLGEVLRSARFLCFCEPRRSNLSRFLGSLLWPVVGRVTKHDMPASIDAGFVPGELPVLLGLIREKWRVEETGDWRGSLRLRAWRE